MFTVDWHVLIRVVIAVPLLYFALIVFIRASGKRTTSQMNSFDWIATVAMGSMVATGILSTDVSLVAVLLAIVCMIALQFLITWLVIRSPVVRELVKPAPRLLVYRGLMLERDMHIERVSELEVRAAARAAGHHGLNDVYAIVLETDATMSVLPLQSVHTESTLLGDVKSASKGVAMAAEARHPGSGEG